MAEAERAWCGRCERQTRHGIVYRTEFEDYSQLVMIGCEILQCRGCESVSLRETSANGSVTHYGPAKSRRSDLWARFTAFPPENLSGDLLALVNEVYAAYDSGLERLTLMGVRSVIELIMIDKVGDHKSFWKNLNEFHQKGHISTIEYDYLRAVIEVGHGVTHKNKLPQPEGAIVAIDIMEHLIATIYIHSKHVKDYIPLE